LIIHLKIRMWLYQLATLLIFHPICMQRPERHLLMIIQPTWTWQYGIIRKSMLKFKLNSQTLIMIIYRSDGQPRILPNYKKYQPASTKLYKFWKRMKRLPINGPKLIEHEESHFNDELTLWFFNLLKNLEVWHANLSLFFRQIKWSKNQTPN